MVWQTCGHKGATVSMPGWMGSTIGQSPWPERFNAPAPIVHHGRNSNTHLQVEDSLNRQGGRPWLKDKGKRWRRSVKSLKATGIFGRLLGPRAAVR
jgi:hypothetical protein